MAGRIAPFFHVMAGLHKIFVKGAEAKDAIYKDCCILGDRGLLIAI